MLEQQTQIDIKISFASATFNLLFGSKLNEG